MRRPSPPTPHAVEAYLRHTLGHVPLRQIAREKAQNPSTVLRQVRRVEDARDDAAFEAELIRQEDAWKSGGSA